MTHRAKTPGNISAVFSSRQGEGLYAGEHQIFIRLAGCPWRCRYCDTLDSLVSTGHPLMTAEEVLERVRSLRSTEDVATVSVTGGEPLLQDEFLRELLPLLKAEGYRVHLETSGTLPEAFKPLREHCDAVAMDVKLPSAAGREFWKEHAQFLNLGGAKVFAKLVLEKDTPPEETERVLHLLASARHVPPLVIQPVTPIIFLEDRLQGRTSPRRTAPPSRERLTAFYDRARQLLPDVHIVPQMHPLWDVP